MIWNRFEFKGITHIFKGALNLTKSLFNLQQLIVEIMEVNNDRLSSGLKVFN